ncbi:MAG: DUF4159 domain-containing protein [Phycisphaerae bacterium]|nr:DUF4159 domain-containing protein [Phycisphaerae bacterium]
MRIAIACSLLALVLAADAAAQPKLNLPGHNNPPPARPQRHSGGEGVPPLPLPATPIRRSEKKREPAPPVLVAKIEYARNFYNVTNDARNLLGFAGRAINDIAYRPADFQWRNFSYDPTEVPIIYLSGHDPVAVLPPEDMRRLRNYLVLGGTLVANACCGSPEFADSFRTFVAELFPERPLQRLPVEHPVFFAAERLEQVRFKRGNGETFTATPLLEGVDLGCRTLIYFASADLANGWYGQDPPADYPPGFWVLKDDARKLGVNLVTTILAQLQYARSFPIAQIDYQADEVIGEPLAIGQLIHGGDWDPNPSALARLQKYIADHSTIPVAFDRAAVDPADASIFGYPVLYLVGHKNFTFTDDQAANLRRYLNQGGVLLAESCCGRKEFDLAFRREIARVLTDQPLEALPPDHGLYDINFRITDVTVTDLARTYYGDLARPHLEAVELNSRLAVLYSPLALGNGWEGIPHPFSAGYHDSDALRLGVNTFTYILSH